MVIDNGVTTFIAVSIPTMILLGLRHAMDADHITAIDNMVRLHNASKKSRWVGAGFSTGHMISVLAEIIFIIFIVGSVTGADELAFWGGIVGASALGTIGAMNIYAMRRWGKTGSAILAGKILAKTGSYNPFVSSLITGIVFGLGFDTATQISTITLSAVASATLGIQVALALSGFFAIGMIPLDMLDSILLRHAFSKIFNNKGFRYMSYALSGAALTVASVASYENLTGAEIMPGLTGPVLAGGIIVTSFAYSFATHRKSDDYNNNIFVKNINNIDHDNAKNMDK
jgi:nickel/cobalt transporter (NiCoT) family protein